MPMMRLLALLSLLSVLMMRVQGTTEVIEEPVSSRSLLKALSTKDSEISLQRVSQLFVALAIARIPEGVPYLIPRDAVDASRCDSICHGSGIGAEHLMPALVSAGILGLKRSGGNAPSVQLVFKLKQFETFKINSKLDIQHLPVRIKNKTYFMLARGKIASEYLSPGGNIIPPREGPVRRPMSREKLPLVVLEIAANIQAKTLENYGKLGSILRLENTPASNHRSANEERNRVAPAVVTPSNNDSTRPTSTAATRTFDEPPNANELLAAMNSNNDSGHPTSTAAFDEPPNVNELLAAMNKACEFAAKQDHDGVLRTLRPFGPHVPGGSGWYKTHVQSLGDKHKVDVVLPNTFKAYRKKDVEMWKASHEELKKMKDAFTKKKSVLPLSAKRHIAAAVAMSPKTSGAAFERMIYGITVALLDKFHIDYTMEQVLDNLPVKSTVEAWIKDLAASVMFICAARLEEENGIGAYLMTDKAEEKVKKGMVKIISKWSPSLANDEWPDGQLFIATIDSDGTGATTEEGAKGVQNSLEKLPNHKTIYFWGFIADSGGGFTRERKKQAMQDLDYCKEWALIANCCCHNMQLTGTVPMKHLFQKGAVGIRSLPQLLHLAHELQDTVLGRRLTRECMVKLQEMGIGNNNDDGDDDDSSTAHTNAEEEKMDILLLKPDDSRWWQTAATCDRLEANLELWETLGDKTLESNRVKGTNADKVGNFLSLLHEPEVLVDISLTAAFFRVYFFHHFKWHQGVDPNIGKPGFLSFHIFIRTLLMRKDLARLKNYRVENVEEMEGFVSRVNAMSPEKQAQQHEKASDFFSFADKELLKMFERWMDTRLFFLAAFGEYETGKLVARYLISSRVITSDNATTLIRPNEPTTFYSEIHKCEIDLRDVSKFIVKTVDQHSIVEFSKTYHFGENQGLFELIAMGSNIWDKSVSSMQAPRRLTLCRYGGLPSNTQMAERGNKNHNICAVNSRGSISVNARVTSRSIVNDQSNVTTVDGKRSSSDGRTHTAEVFGRLQEHVELELECRNHYPDEQVTDWYEHINKKMFNKSETFEEKDYQELKQSIDLTKESTRVPYAAELRTGYDETSYQKRDVRYGKLRSTHVGAMQQELDARGIAYEPTDGIKKLIGILKTKIREDWKQQNPGVHEKVFDDDEKLTKHFKPVTDYSSFAYEIIQ